MSSSVESFGAVTSDLVKAHQSSVVALSATTVDYQAHVGASIEELCDRIKRVITRVNVTRISNSLIAVQQRHCVLMVKQLLIARFTLLCISVQLEHHVRYAFNELCSLLDVARDKVNIIIEEVYGEIANGEIIHHFELLDIFLQQRIMIVVNKVGQQEISIIEKIAQQENYLIRTFCATLLTLLPPPSWGDSVTNYILREGLDSADDFDWTNFLMPGINSHIFREYVTMTTNRFWKAISQDLVAMDHVSCRGMSPTDIYHIAINKGV